MEEIVVLKIKNMYSEITFTNKRIYGYHSELGLSSKKEVNINIRKIEDYQILFFALPYKRINIKDGEGTKTFILKNSDIEDVEGILDDILEVNTEKSESKEDNFEESYIDKCPHCNAEIEKELDSCPNCNRKLLKNISGDYIKDKFSKASSPNNNANIIKTVIGVVVFVVALVWFFSLSESPSSAIERVIKNSSHFYYSQYAVGKFINVSCHELEKDEYNRHLIKCDYSYNPRNGAGSVLLGEVNSEVVYAVLIIGSGNSFDYKFGNYIISLKEESNWGKSGNPINNTSDNNNNYD